MEHRLTKNKAEKYLETGSGTCPRCGSISITGESVEISGPTAWQRCSCAECDLWWTDTYHLAKMEANGKTHYRASDPGLGL